MRLAGRKKDQAWMRTVDFLRLKFGNTERSEITSICQADADVLAMANAYLDIIHQAGVSAGDVVAEDFISTWINSGIPREVWHGYARYDTYAQVDGKDYYAPVHAKVIRKGANALRSIITNYIQSWKMLLDNQNVRQAAQGNPGGVVVGPSHAPPAP